MRATYTAPAVIAAILKDEATDEATHVRYYEAAQAIADAIDNAVGVSFAPSDDTAVGVTTSWRRWSSPKR